MNEDRAERDTFPGSPKYEAMRSAHNQALDRAEAAEARVTELEAMLRACDEHAEHWEAPGSWPGSPSMPGSRRPVMATETEIEAVWVEMRHALTDARTHATPHDPKVEAYWRDRIRLVLDRSRPVSGTQGEDHETVPCRHDWSPFNDPYCTRCGSHKDDVATSPVSGTEPDTAKLVEALRRIERLKDRWSAPLTHPVGDMRDPAYAGAAAWAAVGSEAHKIAVDALAGFSVDVERRLATGAERDTFPGSPKYEAMRSAHNQALDRAEAAEARVAELEAERDVATNKVGVPK